MPVILDYFQAAVGLGQLERLSDRVRRLKEIYQRYREELQEASGIDVIGFDLSGGESPQWID